MKRDYVLITPVHNEEEFIEETIKSVVSQTVLPAKWLIVDDASTDSTVQIIARYQEQYDFIECYRLERGDVISYYSRRTHVFLAGYEKVRQLEFDFIAALDADLQVESDYYENILREFDSDATLGVASGVYLDLINGQPRAVLRSNISTSGGLQIFRRECYEQIGGYVPLRYGGDDSLAEYTARMNGWQTRSFPAYQAIHKRPVGTRGQASILTARFRQGMTDYYLGSHIVFVLAKSLRRCCLERPFVVGGAARMIGFMSAWLGRKKRSVPDEVVRYVRREQMGRLRCITPAKKL